MPEGILHYPFWDTQIGYGILMAVIAIVHVFISHFAIGGGLYLVITEIFARKRNDTHQLEYLKKLSKFFILTTVVLGALTGVAIWVIIGLLNPSATEVLIHNFVWGWAIEWTFFVVELTAAIMYFYGWERLSAKAHITLGWIYFIFAWLSLVAINGIVDFMLTPGQWLETGNFWDGFFNPTFWPSLFFRTGICIMLAGLYSMLVVSKIPNPESRKNTVRYNAIWALAGLVMVQPPLLWYQAAIPKDLMGTAKTIMTFPFELIDMTTWFYWPMLALIILFGFLMPKRMHISVAIILMACGFSFFGSFEWWRESLRKPYIITNYMYGNRVEVSMVDELSSGGFLNHIAYRTGDDGADLFRHQCRSCHTIDGYKALKPHYDGTEPEFIAATILGQHTMKGNMPIFSGNSDEAQLIAAHIYKSTDHRHIKEIYNLNGFELGHKVYEIRCGKCHVVGGYGDVSESLAGMDDDEYSDMLDFIGDLAEEMPDFTGDQTERDALIEYFKTLGKGEINATN